MSRLRHRVRELEQAHTHLQGRSGHWGDGVVPARQTPAFADAQPRISVLMPVFNKEPFLVEALESVVGCGRRDVEILLLDDKSTDQSRDRIWQWMKAHPRTPACLLGRSSNGGVARARNALLARARGEFVFTLDADNGIYPTALDALSAALIENPESSFAYGPIETRRNGTCTGLLSMRPLNGTEMRRGNYVDSMAMFRTSALRQLNGWNEQMHTWEDYELWLRILEAGMTGTFVPQVHSWYGMHDNTLRSAAGLEEAGLWAALRAAAPTIMADAPQG